MPRSVSRRLLDFLSDNSIALASLSIAVMSMYLTITSQRDDREHRELLIKPSLNSRVEIADWSVSIINSGLGPAVIKDSVYRVGAECVAFLKSGKIDQENLFRATQSIGDGFGAIFDATKFKDDRFKATPGAAQVRVPLPTAIIGVNEQLVLYKIDDAVGADLHAKLTESGTAVRGDLIDRFMKYALKLPLRIRYCSMSERYCKTAPAEQTDTTCPLPVVDR